MSVWKKASEETPPIDEEVVILYKSKDKPLNYENLHYAVAKRIIHKAFPSALGREVWSTFIEYQSYYEVVYWAPLYDMPLLEESNND